MNGEASSKKRDKISLPKRLDDIKNIVEFGEVLEAHSENEWVEVNVNNIGFISPTALVLVGKMLSVWKEKRVKKSLKTTLTRVQEQRNTNSYMGHMGFFDLLGSKQNKWNKVGEASGSDSYVPITKIIKPSFTNYTDWVEDIISAVRGLANILSDTRESTEENKFYLYTLREVIRNTFEHSHANECLICGQRWSCGNVEICILDEGIGIPNSLAKNFDINNDITALEMAIKPGVSSVNFSSNENKYENSGFGLYVLSEVVREFGGFHLGSSSKVLTLEKSRSHVSNLEFSGTFLSIQLVAPPKQFSHLLKDIIFEGEKEAREAGRASSASKVSKLL